MSRRSALLTVVVCALLADPLVAQQDKPRRERKAQLEQDAADRAERRKRRLGVPEEGSVEVPVEAVIGDGIAIGTIRDDDHQ
jgi:hypothetical protein